MTEPSWRIDELAHKAGCTVDTIRYYAREGLLQAPEKSGRHKLYGPDHLERLTRIRELQAQRFSLAAIRAIVNVDRPGLEALFAAQGHATRATTSRSAAASTPNCSTASARSACSPTPSHSVTRSTTTAISRCYARSPSSKTSA